MTSPARWLVVSARPLSPEAAARLPEQLLALGGTAVQEDGEVLVTYLPATGSPGGILEQLRAALPDAELDWRWQENQDWSSEWKRGLGPRKLTERLVVKPTWTEWEKAPGEVIIDLDPEMAFGTGEHGTTRGCLRLLDAAIRPGDRVLDVGSGSAILAIAAARLGAREVVAVEYDADANLNARDNLERNGVAKCVHIVERLADAEVLAALGSFDLVLANILSGVIRPLLPAFHQALRGASDPRLIVSGILHAEHSEVVRDAVAAGFRVTGVDTEEEWWSALLTFA